jgi:alkanesulfonate monooxygenase SsuD/methylene tetrahydromethanopterin reductase-like flavin-dependent oxidoreductase (luciferase family)
MADAAIRRAGRLGDGYVRTRGGDLDAMRRDTQRADEAARRAGKDPSSFGFAQLQNAFVWEDGDAWKAVRDGAAHHIGVYAGWAEGSDTPGQDFFIKPPDEATLRHITPAGSPSEIVQVLRPMAAAFADRHDFHLVVRLHYPGMDFDTGARAVELFGTKVIPALKGD